jgi:glucokinase
MLMPRGYDAKGEIWVHRIWNQAFAQKSGVAKEAVLAGDGMQLMYAAASSNEKHLREPQSEAMSHRGGGGDLR